MTGPGRQSLLIVLLATAAAVAGLAAGRWMMSGPAPTVPPDLEVVGPGMPLPQLVLPDLEGQPQTLQPFQGRPLLINYWATWCGPCIQELPRLAELHSRRDRDGIAVLAIALEHDAATVRAFVDEHGLQLPVRIEPPGRRDSSVRLGNLRSVLPYSVLVDADGRIVDSRIGELHDADLADWAERVQPAP